MCVKFDLVRIFYILLLTTKELLTKNYMYIINCKKYK